MPNQQHPKYSIMIKRNILYIPLILLALGLAYPVKNCFAEPEISTDKVLHTSLSIVIGMTAYNVYRENMDLTDNEARLAAFISALAIGASKELFMDDEFDWGDMTANSLGAGIGVMIRF